MNHSLDDEDRCAVCLRQWDGLTPRDRIMLTTKGKCLGRPERWRNCKRYPGLTCWGQESHRATCWDNEDYASEWDR